MTVNCKTTHSSSLVADLLVFMEQLSINAVIVVNDKHQPEGIVSLHDIIKSGII